MFFIAVTDLLASDPSICFWALTLRIRQIESLRIEALVVAV